MKKSILHIGNFLSGHGLTRQFIEELANKLEDAGWIVSRTSNVLFRPFRLFDMMLTILFKQNRYSVAHIAVFSGHAFIWAEKSVWLLKLLNKPFVISLHGGNLPEFSKQNSKRIKFVLKSATYVIAPSTYLFEKMGIYREDIIVINNPLNLPSYQFRPQSKPKPNLIWLRSFHKIYNPCLAPQVLSCLKNDYHDIHLLMIGPDKGDGSFQQTIEMIENLGISKNVELIGRVPKNDVPKWLQTADIFINTTNIDNTPVSVIEAMASGCCIVSTNVGGIPYLLENGVDALLVPPNSAEAMASSVKRILTEPGLAEKLSANARKKAEQFDWSIILPQWEKLLEEICCHG